MRDMVGDVVVMSDPRLSGLAGAERRQRAPGASRDKRCSSAYGCAVPWLPRRRRHRCARHSLTGLYGSPVPLSDGTMVIADDRYIRDCILMPETQIVASYEPSCRPSPA